ncbi:hypothetical protein ABPG72_015677 [Tetrahymena utriculariae]
MDIVQQNQEMQNTSKLPKGYLLLHNIGKKNNMGIIIRSASAFNFEKVFLISKNEDIFNEEVETDERKRKRVLHRVVKEFQMFGNHGTQAQMQFDVFKNLKEAKQYFVQNNIKVCGVEITPDSKSVVTHPFQGDTVFLMGNEGAGLIEAHKKICDHFVYIPQYTNKTASLNVSCAASIIFHHFALWAGYQESQIFGEKFQDQQAIEGEQQEKDSQSDEGNESSQNQDQIKEQVSKVPQEQDAQNNQQEESKNQ